MIDFNVKLGHWPYRPVWDAEALLRRMDALAIERAVLSSLSAVHYFNPQDGNDELFRAVAPHRDRFMPMAVLKPGFAGDLDDLERCLGDYGMTGLVLHPTYHHYTLDTPELAPLMDKMAATGLPVCVQLGMEDMRRQYDRAIVEDVPPPSIGTFMRAWPAVRIVALGLKGGQPEQLGESFPENGYFDISNYEAMDALEHAVARFGAERVLFGTHAPLFTPHANVAKLKSAELTEDTRRAIAEGNARRLLGL